MKKIRTCVVGATGYSGEELIKLLVEHPHAELSYVCASTDKKQTVRQMFPYLPPQVHLECKAYDEASVAEHSDVVFLALPHNISMATAPGLLKRGKKVIDVSADYRQKDPKEYEKNYGVAHTDAEGLKHAVYGLTEYARDAVKKATLIANPGCYPTSALLATLPLVEAGWLADAGAIVLDSKSGVTGAGRKAHLSLSFSEVNESFKAYKVEGHPHTAEIANQLKSAGSKLSLVFIPHLLPINRGILTTAYVPLKSGKTAEELHALFKKKYEKEFFVQVLDLGVLPELKYVNHTNQCHIGIAMRKDLNLAMIFSAIDNLQKGASGQAIQNMNLMYGFDEKAGLR